MVLNKEPESISYFFTKSINVTNLIKNVMDKVVKEADTKFFKMLHVNKQLIF